MANLLSDHWYLRKHEDRSIFGPVSFSKLQQWAQTAQVSPHDAVSEDQSVWTKAPMIPELEMDWLVQLDENLFYGPTTSGAVLEFLTLGEIGPKTAVVNCKDSTESLLEECEFYPEAEPEESGVLLQPSKGSLRSNLQKRIRELEANLLEKQRKLLFAEDTIRRLERRLNALEGGKS